VAVLPGHRGSRSSRVSEASRRTRSGRGVARRPSPAALGLVRVDPDFAQEYPDGDASSTEAHASLVRTGAALLQELDRCMRASFDLPQPAATALAVIDGAGEPLTPTQISERVLLASATMTSTLDLLEDRGWIFRTSNPQDRRSVLVEITPDGRATADRLLAGVRTVEATSLSGLSLAERQQLLRLLAKVLESAAAAADAPPTPLEGRRNRPARLNQQP
jgi:DNA-binding MarR family transcriptional regulator